MRSYRLLRFLSGACAVAGCAALLIAATIAVAASRIGVWDIASLSRAEQPSVPRDTAPADFAADAEPVDSLALIRDPGGAYALEFYDARFFTEAGEAPAQGDYIIISKNLAAPSIYDLFNETKYKPDIDALLAEYTPAGAQTGASLGASSGGGAVYSPLSVAPEPLVLIIHTHGTEGFAAEGVTAYSSDNLPRTTDITQNIVAVGKTMRDTFVANGIPALHCEIMHDKDSYNDSYRNSLSTVLAYLEKFPSIKYVFDVHRDALLGDGTLTKGVCELRGGTAAQVMFVVGTDAGGADYPDWQKNLAFALAAQSLAAGRYPGLMRPVNLRRASFNAQYSQRDLLIEVGACANTLAEAKAAGAAVADILSELIKRGY